MLLRCKEAFGNFKPGDCVEVPDGAVFDHAYFEVVPNFVDDDKGEEGNEE